ncbi:MAG: AAA family ATPase [Gammaproteobacteria bacterium]|nr:AAA family ATPase [Gammaproteobacteria bacterium]
MAISTLSLFISSPGDVNEERVTTARVIKRLSKEFTGRVKLAPVFWEHEPMLMTETFQSQITPPSETDIFICILWSRIGTRLPAQITRADGSRYESGTEFEFEDARAAFDAKGSPEILVYRKMAKPLLNPDMPDFTDRLAQYEGLKEFFQKWFQDEEGSFIAAFNPYDNLAQFEERLEDHLRKLLERRSPPGHTDIPARTWTKGSPFRGLRVFEAEHAPIYFGRTKAVSEVLNALRKQALDKRRFVLILGMSGSGKSSLARAGVLPMLTQAGVIEGVGAWRQAILLPGDLSANMGAGLAKAVLAEQALPALTREDSRHLEKLLRPVFAGNLSKDNERSLSAFFEERLAHAANTAKLPPGQVHLVLFIDQMEEMFTQDAFGARERRAFSRLLSLLARSGSVWVLATFRSEFYHRCAELPELAALMEGNGHYLLTPPGTSEISQMIRLPACAAGLQFELDADAQTRLDEILLNAMVENPESLPLLEFTLEALYQQRDPQGFLSLAAYKAMGGLEGALAQWAEQVFNKLSPRAQAAFPALMRTLVTVGKEGQEPMTGRRILYHTLSADDPIRELLEAFINARLVIADQTSDGTAFARISHEALLHHWPRLQEWLAEDRNLLRVRARVTVAANHWQAEKHPDDLLLSEGKPLNEAEDLLRQWPDAILENTKTFIKASMTAAAQRYQAAATEAQKKLRGSRQLSVVFALLAILAIIGGYSGFHGQNIAEQKTRAAEAQKDQTRRIRSLSLATLAKQEIQKGNAGNGILLALEALPASAAQTEKIYVNEAVTALYRAVTHLYERAVLSGHASWVRHAVFSPDGRYVITASEDNTARIWEIGKALKQTSLTAVLKGHKNVVNYAVFSPDGKRAATASNDNTVRIWTFEADAAGKTAAHFPSGVRAGESEQLGKWRADVLAGHESAVYRVVFSADGKRVVTASDDATARIWDLDEDTGANRRPLILKGHEGPVYRAVFSPDGKRVLTASKDGTARIWDALDAKLLAVLSGHDATLTSAVFSPDGKRALSASWDNTARLWDAETGKPLAILSGHKKNVVRAVFSPDGKRALTASSDNTARIWDAKTGQQLALLEKHESAVNNAVFSPDGQLALTSSEDRSARVWNSTSGKLLLRLTGHGDNVMQAAFSPNGRLAVTASMDNTARLWEISANSGKRFIPLTGHQDAVYHAAFSADGKRAATASDDGDARIWDTDNGDLLKVLTGHQAEVAHVAFSPDGRRVATASFDNTACLWDNGSGRAVLSGHTDMVWLAAFSADGQKLITASGNWAQPKDTTARLWDTNTGKPLAILKGHRGSVKHAAFSADGRRVITASADSMARIWDAKTGDSIAALVGHENSVRYAAFAPDGRYAVTASDDNTARLWNAHDGEPLTVLAGHENIVTHAAFSPKGTRVATASWDKTVRLWHIGKEAKSATLIEVLSGHEDWVTRAEFSRNGQQMITASYDKTARLWDVREGKIPRPIAIMTGHEDRVAYAAFSPDGKQAITASIDGSARLWPIFPDTQSLIEYARQIVPRLLTAEQRTRFFLE